MSFPIETLVFVAYLDQLFSETNAPDEVIPLEALPETLNRLHAGAMRRHARRSALSAREDGQWTATPDWRFDRQIIRLGLYLRERLDLAPGERVALVSELRPEWLIADLAALGLGAVSVAIDPRLQGDELATALEDAAPSITFVSPEAQHALRSLNGRAPPHGQVIALDSDSAGDAGLELHALLEMAGTLDTPERAQSYRAGARELSPDQPAIRHYRQSPHGGWDRIELSQGQVMERLGDGWLREPARSGDVAYVSDPTVSLAARLALYAFLGDGYTTTALAPARWELSDLAGLRPAKIVASAAQLAEAIGAAATREDGRRGNDGGWLSHAARLVPRARAHLDQRVIRERLGGRVRWIGSIDGLDSALAEQLGGIAVVGPAPI